MSVSLWRCPWFLAAVLLSWSPDVRAAAPPAGALAGTVYARDGSRLPGVDLSLANLETQSVVRLATGALGVFRAGRLPAGDYELRAELTGFEATVVSGVTVRAGETTLLEVRLDVSTVREYVAVMGIAPRDSMEASELRESPARDVGEALAGMAGIWKLRKGGIASDVVLHGFQSQDLNVLIDGERIYGACPNHMDPASFHVDFSQVDRIEVGKGPFDVQNQGGLGGAVNIVTQRPEQGWHVRANLTAGSYGFVNPSATVSYGSPSLLALTGYSYRASEAHSDGSGTRYTEGAGYRPEMIEEDAFDVRTAWGRLAWAPAAGHRVQLSYTRQDASQVYYPYLLMDAVYDDTDRVGIRYEAEELSGALSSLLVQGYFAQVSHWMTNEYRLSAGTAPRGYSMGTMARTKTLGGKAQARLGKVTLGFEAVARQWDATTEMAAAGYAQQHFIPDVTIGSLGLFAEYTDRLAEALSLSAGARVDRAHSSADPAKANTDLYFAYHGTRSTSGTDVTPAAKLRLDYEPSRSVELSLGVGHAVRVPDAAERYSALRRMGADRVGDPGLAPSRNTGIDLAASLERSGLYVAANLYVNRVSDFIVVREQRRVNQVSGVRNERARSFANVDATLWGWELDAVWSLPHHLFLSGDVSYVRGTRELDPERGILTEELAEMPPLSSRARLRFDDGRLSVVAEGVLVAAQRRVDAELGEEETPGYAIANLHVLARRGRLSLTAGVANLFDRTYSEFLSYQRDPFRSGVVVHEPGRNLFANLAYRF